MKRLVFLIVALLSLSANSAWAQKEQRVALVIGNSAYQHAEPLKNPVNDARAMAATLKNAGFEVILRENATRRTFVEALHEFAGKVPPGGVGLFYYAGHGMQVRGVNHLVPIDAALTNEYDVKYETVDVNDVLGRLDEARARLSLVILDACRDNPFARRFRSTGRGLAQTDAPRGTVIAYATAPGDTAADGDGENGVYTAELLKAIAQPGLKLEEVFKRAIDGVARATANKQTPWVSSSFRGDFVFNAAAVAPPPPVAAAPPPPVAPPQTSQDAIELAAWNAIANSSNPAMFELFLKRFPNGNYADFARAKLEELKAAKAGPSPEEIQRSAAAEDARRKAEIEAARRQAIEEARRAAQDEARRVAAAEEARRKADGEAKRAADEEARRTAAAEEAKRRAAADEEKKKSVEGVEAALKLADIDRRRIQAALTAKGFDTLGTDGAFGPRTRQMIANWQRTRSEPPTGFLTATQASLLARDGEAALAKLEDDRRKAEAERAKAAPPPPPAATAAATPTPAPAPAPAPQVAAIAPGGATFDGNWVGQMCRNTGCGPANVQVSQTRLRGTSSARGVTHNLEGTVQPGGQVRVRYTGIAPPGNPNEGQPFDWTLTGTASGNSLTAQVTNSSGVTFRLSLQRTQ